MTKAPRRRFLGVTAAGGLGWLAAPGLQIKRSPRDTDVRIADVSFDFEEYLYRAPYKFGGVPVDRTTLLNVRCEVENLHGRRTRGVGSMTLGNAWSFPSRTLPYDLTLNAMKKLAERVRKLIGEWREWGHPIEVAHGLEPEYLRAASDLSRELDMPEPIPKLAVLVTASPFDASLHDAYGKLHGRSCYLTYGKRFLPRDLSEFLTREFKGEYAEEYMLKAPKPRLAVYHSVGAADPLTEADLTTRINDGLPETLPEWIAFNGITHFKIKLNGDDLDWDIDRTLAVDRIVNEELTRRGATRWRYCLDFNERCPNVAYLLDFLNRVREKTPNGFPRIQYVEQPTMRDLKADRNNAMHEAAKFLPVVADEAITNLESLMLARKMGYTGVALKACKGQTQSVLTAAAGQKFGMFLCVQDLTCPGAALLHSASLTAHTPGATTLEANARQYVPAANKPWERKFPGIFVIRDGTMDTSALSGPGLGIV